MKNSVRVRTNILLAGIVLAIGILVFGFLSQAGFVISGVYIVKGGTLDITNALPGSIVFVDEKRIGTVGSDGTASFNGIRPGERDVIVSRPDVWPWILTFESQAGLPNTFSPLQVRQDAQGGTLSDANDPLLITAKQAFTAYREPTRINPLERDGTIVWVDGSTIYMQKNGAVRTIFASVNPIQTVSWYGDRNDAIIVATQNTVAVLDLRGREVQNYLPMYKGVSPQAVADPIRSSHIFVHDEGNYFTIDL